jgi:hypothetical protein
MNCWLALQFDWQTPSTRFWSNGHFFSHLSPTFSNSAAGQTQALFWRTSLALQTGMGVQFPLMRVSVGWHLGRHWSPTFSPLQTQTPKYGENVSFNMHREQTPLTRVSPAVHFFTHWLSTVSKESVGQTQTLFWRTSLALQEGIKVQTPFIRVSLAAHFLRHWPLTASKDLGGHTQTLFWSTSLALQTGLGVHTPLIRVSLGWHLRRHCSATVSNAPVHKQKPKYGEKVSFGLQGPKFWVQMPFTRASPDLHFGRHFSPTVSKETAGQRQLAPSATSFSLHAAKQLVPIWRGSSAGHPQTPLGVMIWLPGQVGRQ